jgi:hypothetical protein
MEHTAHNFGERIIVEMTPHIGLAKIWKTQTFAGLMPSGESF